MDAITELLRLDSPTPAPSAIAFDGELLWVGSTKTERLYAIAPSDWTVRNEIAMPGRPYGMTVAGDALRVILGQGEDDDRTIYRVELEGEFSADGAIRCPDDGTGSHLSYDGERLYVSQWGLKRIVAIDDAGTPGSVIDLPYGICGQTIVDGRFYCILPDDGEGEDYFLARIDARGAAPVIDMLAEIHFATRGIAFDGERFWTNDRDANQIVAFTKPD
jgi:hypothetical protein